MNCIFGVDIGGTKVKIGKFINDELIQKEEISTNKQNKGTYIIPEIINKINEMKTNEEIIGIGLGVPGPAVDGIVYGANNLGWGIVDIKSEIINEFPNIKVEVINDANAAALGEAKKTLKNEAKNMILVTLGTGIGGGIVINGQIFNGYNGSAGEIGHIKVEHGNKRKCTCGLYDCVECYSSAAGIEKTAREVMGKELSCKEIFDLAKNGNVEAMKVIDDAVDKLSIALASVANTINPEVILIGGGVSKAGEFLLKKIEDVFVKYAFHTVKNTKLKLASLGNDAGMYGCFYQIKGETND